MNKTWLVHVNLQVSSQGELYSRIDLMFSFKFNILNGNDT